jgi:micrococcal nuclease
MYEYRCKILRIVDGDTVDIDIDLGFGVWMHKERVRMYGIDTPESRTKDLEEKKYGLMSKDFVKSMMPIGSMQTLRTAKYDDKGKFGRILGEFIVYDSKDDKLVSLKDIMIRECLGVEYYGQSKEEIEESHIVNREQLKLLSGGNE